MTNKEIVQTAKKLAAYTEGSLKKPMEERIIFTISRLLGMTSEQARKNYEMLCFLNAINNSAMRQKLDKVDAEEDRTDLASLDEAIEKALEPASPPTKK